MKKILTLMFALALCNTSWAYIRENIAIKSQAMNKEVPVTVILPNAYHSMESMPVVYLLHGYGDNHSAWDVKGNTGVLADQYNVILVMPDGGKSSWYWDSPVDPTYNYETFVSIELIKYIDSHYKTKADRSARAITGLSMGGHGAMYLAIRHQELFGAAGSTSGGVDIRPFPKNWGMAKHLGEHEKNLEVWNNHTVINQLERLKDGNLAIIIDCGVDDFFYGINKAVHERLLLLKIKHDFIIRPGAHNGDYWKNSIGYQIKFFKKFFEQE